MKKTVQLSVLFLLSINYFVYPQSSNSLQQKLSQIIEGKKATVGIAVQGYNSDDTVSVNGDKKFPLQSVFKFHIALAVLKEVDEGKFGLDQRIKINKEDLEPNLYSPIRDKYPNGVDMKLSEILRYTVAESDNVGCDLLLKLIGGPEVVEKYLRSKNVYDFAIKYNEKTQQSKWEHQFENWTTPKSANFVLKKFFENKDSLLSPRSYDFLLNTMKGTKTGQKSLRGELPPNTVIAHKTGHSGTNNEGITGAVNDIGIVFLPNGKYFYISVFVSNSKENEETNQRIIADAAKAAWEYFNNKYAK